METSENEKKLYRAVLIEQVPQDFDEPRDWDHDASVKIRKIRNVETLVVTLIKKRIA
jgi:hypothetical protein